MGTREGCGWGLERVCGGDYTRERCGWGLERDAGWGLGRDVGGD